MAAKAARASRACEKCRAQRGGQWQIGNSRQPPEPASPESEGPAKSR